MSWLLSTISPYLLTIIWLSATSVRSKFSKNIRLFSQSRRGLRILPASQFYLYHAQTRHQCLVRFGFPLFRRYPPLLFHTCMVTSGVIFEQLPNWHYSATASISDSILRERIRRGLSSPMLIGSTIHSTSPF